MGDYRKLQVWQRAHRLTVEVYQVSRAFPREEQYGLTSQLRRAASSIPANIAEGCRCNGDTELARFLVIALGSANELDYHLLLARDLGYLPPTHHEQLTFEAEGVSKMLSAFIDQLRRPSKPIADSR